MPKKKYHLFIIEAVAKPDNSGIPKQDIDFKFNLRIKTDAEELSYAIMF